MAWRGSARAATMAPRQGKAPMTRRQDTAPTSTRSHRGEGQAARDEARGHHGRDPMCRRRRSRGHKGAIDQISWTGRCAIAGSIDQGPSRRLTSAGAARIEPSGGEGDAVARARARGGREVDVSSGRVGLTEPPGRVRPGRPAQQQTCAVGWGKNSE
jgi:hypothetical protein